VSLGPQGGALRFRELTRIRAGGCSLEVLFWFGIRDPRPPIGTLGGAPSIRHFEGIEGGTAKTINSWERDLETQVGAIYGYASTKDATARVAGIG
jgi:hypothetical protein